MLRIHFVMYVALLTLSCSSSDDAEFVQIHVGTHAQNNNLGFRQNHTQHRGHWSCALPANNGKVFIKSHRAVRLQDDAGTVKLTTNAELWESWTISESTFSGTDNGKYYIKSHRAVRLQDNAGTVGLTTYEELWESWTLSEATCSNGDPNCQSGKVYIKSHRNQLLSDSSGSITLSADEGSWQQWAILDMSSNAICKERSCTCANGTAVAEEACTVNGGNQCQKCNEGVAIDGYTLNGQECVFTHMSCADPTKGFVNHGDSITGWIKSCPKNLPFNNKSLNCATTECLVDPDRFTCCTQNICICENGVPANGTSCESHLAEDCGYCNPGYHLSADAGPGTQTCVENVCVCQDGTPTTGPGNHGCAEEGSTDCSYCNAGFHPNSESRVPGQICLPNICTCPDGTATTSSGNGARFCRTNNTVDCQECDDYFQIETFNTETGQQQCIPEPCSKELPSHDQYEYDVSECNGDIYEGNSCFVSCPDGLYGIAAKYTCTNLTLAGAAPECRNVTCNGIKAGPLLTRYTTSDCGIEQPTDTCEAQCLPGYHGESQTYTCQEDGNFTPYIPMNCSWTPCNASHQPANGNNGSCHDNLASGESCHIECDDNYTRHGGPTSCLAGTLQVVETCRPDPCDASRPPDNGAVGDCNDSLPSGASCTPECHDGYFLDGLTSCYVGASPDNVKVLTEAICVPYCKCELIYLKQCVEQYGYWTEEEQYLDYPGCERFCNEMNLGQGIDIYGCELENVSGEARSTKGHWCFAHLNQCDYGEDLPNNAAAKCMRFTSQEHVD